VTASALYPAHASLISLTIDDSVRPNYVAPRRPRAVGSVLDRVAQGDTRAMRECVDRFGDLIWSIARLVMRTPGEAEDAVQEIFADVWRTAGRFDPEQGSEEVFVTMIARRRLIDRMRRAAHRDRVHSVSDMDSRDWANAANGGEVCAEALAAGRAVMLLRPELQRVLKLGLLQGLTQAEIAHALRLPLDTVKTLMRSGLIQAREFMAK